MYPVMYPERSLFPIVFTRAFQQNTALGFLAKAGNVISRALCKKHEKHKVYYCNNTYLER